MAYSATITATVRRIGGVRHLRLEIVEAEAATASEWSWGDSAGEDLPPVGTITLYQSTLGAGAGASIAPTLGKAASFSPSTQDVVTAPPTAAAAVHDQSLARYVFPSGSRPVLYGRSAVDSGADNDVVTILEIVEGHLPS